MVQHSHRLRLVVTLGLLGLAGCIQSESYVATRYDAKKDELHCLHCYVNITWNKETEFDHLQSLWRNRNYLIPQAPLPFGDFQLFGATGWLKTGRKDYVIIPFGEPANNLSAASALEAPCDLSEFAVKPGTFFLSPEKGLSAFQGTVLSGNALNAMLLREAAFLVSTQVPEIASESNRRAAGGKAVAWETVRQMLTDSFVSARTSIAPGEKSKHFTAFTEESLRLLAKLKPGDFALTRKGLTVSARIPMAEADAKELAKLPLELRDAIEKKAKRDGDPDGELARLKRIAESIQFQAEDGRLQITFSLEESLGSTASVRRLIAARKEPDQERKRSFNRFVAAARKMDLPIDTDITLAGLLDAFDRGTVPVRPSEEKIEPGVGLFGYRP